NVIVFSTSHRQLHSTLFPYTTLFRSIVAEAVRLRRLPARRHHGPLVAEADRRQLRDVVDSRAAHAVPRAPDDRFGFAEQTRRDADRKSTRLNSSHQIISYAVFCLKKK